MRTQQLLAKWAATVNKLQKIEATALQRACNGGSYSFYAKVQNERDAAIAKVALYTQRLQNEQTVV